MSFSHSSISLYEQCPFKYKLTRIDKLQDVSGDAAERGKLLHTEFEQAILALPLLDVSREYWYDYVMVLKGKKAVPEMQFAITEDWVACDFNDANAWIRGIFDAVYFEDNKAHVLDWKSGKEREYGSQLKLYAAILLALYPSITHVTKEICYIDKNKRVSYGETSREELPTLKEWVQSRVSKINADKIYAPNPSWLCKWCTFRKDNGGPCQW
jgi:CRISPR/Cas system-associated exonuclease Cas4 (RecB family)